MPGPKKRRASAARDSDRRTLDRQDESPGLMERRASATRFSDVGRVQRENRAERACDGYSETLGP